MSVTYGVAGTSPFRDFTADLENYVIQYIFDEWSIADPAKPVNPHGESNKIEFRPGFDRGAPPYQVLCIQTNTDVLETSNAEKSWHMVTHLEITVITNIMEDIDNVKPQLGYMEREVQRILNQFRYMDIEGIERMMFTGQARVYDDIISGANSNPQVRGSQGGRGSSSGGGTSWATSRWKTRLYADCYYWKDDISS